MAVSVMGLTYIFCFLWKDLWRKLYGCLLSSSRHARDNCVMYDASLNLGRRWNEIEVKVLEKDPKAVISILCCIYDCKYGSCLKLHLVIVNNCQYYVNKCLMTKLSQFCVSIFLHGVKVFSFARRHSHQTHQNNILIII